MVRSLIVVFLALFAACAHAEDYVFAERAYLNGAAQDWLEGAKSVDGKLLWVGGYRESDYKSIAAGVGAENGALSGVVFVGRANDAGTLKTYYGAWANYETPKNEAYSYFEKSVKGGKYYKVHARHYLVGEHLFVGVMRESEIPWGPTVGLRYGSVKFWVHVPVKAPRDGRSVSMGASVQF